MSALSKEFAAWALAPFLPMAFTSPASRNAAMGQQATTSASTQAPSERRQRLRVEQYFECTWLGDWGEERCRISSLSPTGCYIEGRFSVPPIGTLLQAITITLPTGPIIVAGEVVHMIPGIGFAVRFTEVDDDARARLNALAQHRSR